MKINIIVKVLIVNGILCFPFNLLAWTVSEKEALPSKVDKPVSQESQELEEHQALQKSTPIAQSKKENSRNMEGAIFDKKPTKLTLDERISNDYRRALEYLANREVYQAESILNNNLQLLPSHHPSRVELATYYLRNHQLEEAESLLQEGLRFDERHPEFLRLMAVVCDQKEEPERALALLMKVKDSERQDNNYISFLGHIHQELGNYALARQQYFKLLQQEPQNSLWLLGVSIALDSEGQRDAALEGYRRLVNESNLEPDVRQYIKDRIQNLKG